MNQGIAPEPSPSVTRPGGGGSSRTVALVGVGFIADYHMEILRGLPDVQVIAACDPQRARLDAFCDRWGISQRTTSLSELAAIRPDVAHVLVPPAIHHQVAKSLLESGIAVHLEKPM